MLSTREAPGASTGLVHLSWNLAEQFQTQPPQGVDTHTRSRRHGFKV